MGIAEAPGNGEPTGQPPPASMPKTHWFRAPARAKIVLSHPRIIWEPKTLLHPHSPPQEKTSHRSPFFSPPAFSSPHPLQGKVWPRPWNQVLAFASGRPLHGAFACTVLNLPAPQAQLVLQISAFLSALTGPPTPPRPSESTWPVQNFTWGERLFHPCLTDYILSSCEGRSWGRVGGACAPRQPQCPAGHTVEFYKHLLNE